MKKTIVMGALKGGDWGMDLLFAGLCRVLGPENVIDFPTASKYREGVPKLTGDCEADWGKERRSLGFVSGFDKIPRCSQSDVVSLLRTGEIARIFVDEREETYQSYLQLRANFSEAKVVVVGGHDKFWNNSPEYVAKMYGKNFEAMFLDNWRKEYNDLPNTYVYNWSANFDHLWTRKPESKIYDISFTGYNSHPSRATIIDHILKEWPQLKMHVVLERRPNKFDVFVPKAEYFKIMAQSKICLNLRGDAENGKAMRFYEIPYVGSFMLSQWTDAVQTHPFTHLNHCVYFKDLAELDLVIEKYLKDEVEREKIAASGHDHLMQYHTCEARVREMLEILDG